MNEHHQAQRLLQIEIERLEQQVKRLEAQEGRLREDLQMNVEDLEKSRVNAAGLRHSLSSLRS